MKKISYVLVLLILLVFCYQNIQAYEEYQVGRKVIYNDEDYYVIRKSDKNKKYVTLIRNRPLSMQELIEYGSDVQNSSYAAKVTYVSPDVYIPANNYRNNYLYADSYVKSLVDYWMENYLNMDDLVIDSNGYKARIIDNSDLSALEYVVTPYYYQNGPEIHIRGFTYNLDGSEKPWLNYNNENMLTSIFFEDHTMSSPSSDRTYRWQG